MVDWQVVPTNPYEDRYTPEFTKPVIADGRLYTVNRLRFSTMVERPDRQFLRAYDATTGEELWEYAFQHGNSAFLPPSPVVGDGVVLVGHDQRLRAIGPAEGNEMWRRNLGEVIHAVYPGVDRTYVRAHRSVVAVNGNDTRAWTKEFEEFPGALARGDDNLYVAVSRRVLALDPATGDVRWRQTLPAVGGGHGVRSLVTVAGGVFVLQNSGDLYAFSGGGERIWRADDRCDSLSTDGSRLYAGTKGTLRALAVATGKKVWELRCGDLAGCDSASRFGKPAVTDSALYASLDSGLLAAVRPDDGTVLWSLDETTGFEHLALGSDAVYGVGSEDEPLVRLRPS